MNIDVALLPRDVQGRDLTRHVVVVFDVLRATTTITAALAAGVNEIHIFGDIAAAKSAASGFSPNRLLCGEVNCLAPTGFDLGNSPGAIHRAEHAGRPMLLATTNGTRAVLAAAAADVVLCGALVNAGAVADALIALDREVLLLCAGTQGAVAMEDLLGAGAVIDRLRQRHVKPRFQSDVGLIARALFEECRDRLPEALRQTAGGQNVINAGLEPDIDFAAKIDSLSMVGAAAGHPPVIRPLVLGAKKTSAGSGPVGGGNRC